VKKPDQHAVEPNRLTIELDHEVIADLEATDLGNQAIRGGGRRTSECRAATNAG